MEWLGSMLLGWLHVSPEFAVGLLAALLAVSEVLGTFEYFKSSAVFTMVVGWLKKAKDAVSPPK